MADSAPVLAGTATEQNLRAALAHEAEAAVRYRFVADQADVAGSPAVAVALRDLAAGEVGHAADALELLAEHGAEGATVVLDDTAANLQSSAEAERRVADETYPAFAETARLEGFAEIGAWFDGLAAAERRQAEQLDALLADGDG